MTLKGKLSLSLLVIAGLLNTACTSIAYYSQSVKGHLEVWWPQTPIEEIVNNPQTPASLKTKLITAREIRSFASSDLLLPDNDSYTAYTDLGRPHVVWNIVAAPEFSLTPKRWCYLVVGCLSYRGYFSKEDALAYSKSPELEGHDVSVGGVSAYSTLGWFDDPLLNTMIHWSDRQLAGLIFHELAHQVVYIANDTSFNEAFASAVERIGVAQWLAKQTSTEIDEYLGFLKQQEAFRELLLETRSELKTIYEAPIDNEEKRQKKVAALEYLKNQYEQAKQSWPNPQAFDNWFNRPVNNARLVASMTYLEKIPAFYALFIQSGKNWGKFYSQVKIFEDMDQASRDKEIKKLGEQDIRLEEAVISPT